MKNCLIHYPSELISKFSKGNVSGAITGNILVPLIIVFSFNNIIPAAQLYIWFALHVSVFLARIIFRKKISSHLYVYSSLISFSSVLYALFAWMSFTYGDDIYLLLAGMIVASVAAASMISLVSIFHIFVLFVTIQMVGLIVVFLLNGQNIFYLSVLLVVVFLFFILLNGYKQFSILKEEIKLKKQVHDLLDNAGQGFLSFDENLKCQSSYSQECKRIFGIEDIEGLDISNLLFSGNSLNGEIFIDGISRACASEDEDIKEMFLSLLPKEEIIGDKSIKIEYKNLKKNRYMVILSDITNTKGLTSKLENQYQIQKMIVAIASDKNDFIELKDDFEQFTNNISNVSNTNSLTIIRDILRELHTFKGIFAQKEMLHITAYILEVEKKIRNLCAGEDIISTLIKANLHSVFEEDLTIIRSILGDGFLTSPKSINVDIDSIDDIESSLIALKKTLSANEQKNLNNTLTKVQRLKHESLKHMLNPFVSHIKQLSSALEKEIYPLEIKGDEKIKIDSKFKPFIKSLVHLFNNCADHGIEDIETRAMLNKDEVGTIKCSFEIVSNMLIIQISDDGGGIDTKELSLTAINKALKTKEELELMSQEDKCKLIFTDKLSTKEDISMVSGVGIGMGVIKENLEKLDAKYTIENIPQSGVTFTFYIPLNINRDEDISNEKKIENICDNILTQIEVFLKNSLKLEIKSIKQITDVSIDKSYAQIDLYDTFDGNVIMLFSDEIIEFMSSALIPKNFDKTDIAWMSKELPSEVLNTIVGLSLQYFDKSLKDVKMTPPLYLDNTDLTKALKDAKNKFIQEIETSSGKIVYIVFEKEKP